MKRDFKVSFFQVNMQKNSETFEDYLQRIQALKQEERTETQKNVRVDNLSFDDCKKLWTGAITKIRMESLPERMNQKTGACSSLPISDDEGIAETTAFLFDPAINILLTQRSSYGPRESVLAEYVQKKCNSLPFEINVVLKKDMYERLKNVATLYRLECATAKLSPDAFSSNKSAGSFLRSLGTTDYVSINLILTAEKKQGLAPWIKDLALLLIKNISGRYKKLRIGSTFTDGSTDILDLLSAKKEEIISLERDSFRTISFITRKGILSTAYATNKENLYELFGKN